MKKFSLLMFIVIETLVHVAEPTDDSWNDNQRLRKKLLKNYDNMSLPTKNRNGTVGVDIGMSLRNIWLDDDTQIMTVNSWMRMVWNDKRLSWDSKDYGGLQQTHLGDNELWKPDLVVYNNADVSEIDHYGNVHFLVYPTGEVLWVPPANIRVYCAMDLRLWPFDDHDCSIDIASWTTHGDQVNLTYYNNEITVDLKDMLTTSSNWKVLNASQERRVKKYACCSEPYVSMIFKFKLQRNSPSLITLTIVPAVVIPLFLLIQFVLPVNHTQRLTVAAFCSLFALLEMIYLKFSLPKLGTNSPLIVSYFSELLVVSVVIAGLSAVLSRLVHPQNPLVNFPPSEVVKRIFMGPVATVLCLKFHTNNVGHNENMSGDTESLESSKTTLYSQQEWFLVARVMDRMALILFATLIAISLLAYVAPLN